MQWIRLPTGRGGNETPIGVEERGTGSRNAKLALTITAGHRLGAPESLGAVHAGNGRSARNAITMPAVPTTAFHQSSRQGERRPRARPWRAATSPTGISARARLVNCRESYETTAAALGP
jgi:hypothetical protein